MSFDTAYEAITESNDSRWAFGTGFDEPLAGVDTSVPSGVDGDDLAEYCLMLGDDALILSHRLQQWCTNAPELEDEVALANIALDLLGQARLLLARAGKAAGSDRAEDSYAYFRDAEQFRNVQLVEHPNGDFACSIARLLIFASWRLAVLHRLTDSRDPVLAAIAAKGVKELTYHRDYAAHWVVRLGDGTSESHRRMAAGLREVWPSVAELFVTHPVEQRLLTVGVAVDPSSVRPEFDAVLAQVFATATLDPPTATLDPPTAAIAATAATDSAGVPVGPSGRSGSHTPALAEVLTELQSVARDHPDATW
jgi:ring-1,2-phenylacetyl-CoA epoxidase subunit PaaC